jgi:phage-related protein
MDDAKPVVWMGSSQADLREFPRTVRRLLGHALWQVQQGREPYRRKALKGFRGGGVLELIASRMGGTYRVVYMLRFKDVVYVLHAFQKKAKHGIKTPAHEMEVVRKRLKAAEDDHAQRQKRKST